MPTIVFDEVRLKQGDFLLDVSLDIPKDKLSVILGPSGSGKSTLLDICAGFVQPDSGRVLQGVRDVTLLPPEVRNIGMVFQDHALFPHMTVEDNAAFALRMKGLSKKGARKQAYQKLVTVGLGGLAKRYPSSLSGGERQRVSVARALAAEPSVLLLDEPFSSLDPTLRIKLRREVRRIIDASGTTALLVTHDQEEALVMADFLAIMHNGCIVSADTPANIWSNPGDPFVSSFLGRKTWLRIIDIIRDSRAKRYAVTSAGRILIPDGNVRIDLPAFIMIRPEFLLPVVNGQLCGRIVLTEFAGSGWWLEAVPVQHKENDLITLWWPKVRPPAIGDLLYFEVNSTGVRLISDNV